jgi:preflagellin peptidase FlaK
MGAELTIEAIFRVVLSIGMLSFASYKDIKTREISDLVWIIFGTAGLILNIYEFYSGTLGLIPLLVAVGFSIGFAIITGYLGLFGGADLLAIVVIGILNPVAPDLEFGIPLISSVIFPLTVISNSVLIGASGIVVVFFYNLINVRDTKIFQGYAPISIWRKIALFFTGLNKNINTIRGPPFEYPLEKIVEFDIITLLLIPNFFDDLGATETIEKLRSMNRKRLWVSYSLPFLFILEIGYLSSIFFGDFVLWWVARFIH